MPDDKPLSAVLVERYGKDYKQLGADLGIHFTSAHRILHGKSLPSRGVLRRLLRLYEPAERDGVLAALRASMLAQASERCDSLGPKAKR